jgi:bacillithiol biosynthesis deacetylase BshB1
VSALPTVELLAVGAHPDDVEIGCGGLLVKAARDGRRTGVVDLTAGEAASAGDPATRRREAEEAAQVLGLAERRNLALPDAGLHRHDRAQLEALVAALRDLRPAVLLLPFPRCSHPDHVEAGHLGRRAAHLAGLRRWGGGGAFRPSGVLYYESRVPLEPHLLVDVSDCAELKRAAIACYRSQFERGGDGATSINDPRFLAAFRARSRWLGTLLGVEEAEPYRTGSPLPLEDPVALFRSVPGPAGRILGG